MEPELTAIDKVTAVARYRYLHHHFSRTTTNICYLEFCYNCQLYSFQAGRRPWMACKSPKPDSLNSIHVRTIADISRRTWSSDENDAGPTLNVCSVFLFSVDVQVAFGLGLLTSRRLPEGSRLLIAPRGTYPVSYRG